MRLYPILLTALGLIALLVWSCDDGGVIRSGLDYKVTGQVDAWGCWCGNTWDTGEHRYTVATGKQALVTFIDEHGNWCGTRTDDSSVYTLTLPAGIYRAIIETAHAVPDTFTSIHIGRDTTATFCTVYDWYSPDTITARFLYSLEADSLGRDSEIVFVEFAQSQLRDLIDISHAERVEQHFNPPTGPMYVKYRIPIGDYPMWYVSRQADIVRSAHLSFFPQFFEMGPDILLCFK
jgi:hypothetical protein